MTPTDLPLLACRVRAALVLVLLVLSGCDCGGAGTGAEARTVRIGFQKVGTLYLLRGRGDLDRRLAAEGWAVEWVEFPSGPALFEALRAGAVEFGYVGETPPIFAQAGGVPFVYVGHEPPSPRAEAILVPAAGGVRSLAELRGRRVALNRGSNVHYLLLRGLAEAGLEVEDVELLYLPPADGRAAFDSGHVDAWLVWDPFLAAAELDGARILRDGQGLVENRAYYVARRAWAERNAPALRLLTDALRDIASWANEHPEETARLYAESTGLPLEAMARAEARHAYGVRPMSDEIARAQQVLADAFHEAGLVPRSVAVAEAFPARPLDWFSGAAEGAAPGAR